MFTRALSTRLLATLVLALAATAAVAQPKQGTGAEQPHVLAPLVAVTGEAATLTDEEATLLADARAGRLHRLSLAEAALIADGVSDATKRKAYLARIDLLEREARRVAAEGTPLEKGDRLLRWLHAGAMKKGYRKGQSSLAGFLDTGNFNCLSSTVLYTVLGRRLGLDVRSVQVGTDHVHAVLHAGGRQTVVETTNPRGFNPPGKRTARCREVGELGLVAAVYSNRVADLMKAKRYPEALRAGLCGLQLDAEGPVLRKNTTAVFVSWSAELGRAGQSEQALRVAGAGLRQAPKDVKLRGNHRVALHNWVVKAVKAGEYEAALGVLARHGQETADAALVKKLRTSAYTGWAKALMDAEDWPGASRVLHAACKEFPRDRGFQASLKKCRERLGNS
jgi:hypothetical protein